MTKESSYGRLSFLKIAVKNKIKRLIHVKYLKPHD